MPSSKAFQLLPGIICVATIAGCGDQPGNQQVQPVSIALRGSCMDVCSSVLLLSDILLIRP
jgi:hypothetical protein